MDKYIVSFIDAGNCEIDVATIEVYERLPLCDILVVTFDEFVKRHDHSQVAKITIEIAQPDSKFQLAPIHSTH